MMAPSEMVAWACGTCTSTNEDVQRRDCQLCMTERPVRYAIMAGAAGAATARMMTVNCREQARLAALAAPDVPAAVAEQAPAVVEEAPAVAEEQPAAPDGRARAVVLTRILNTMVDILGTSAEDRGRSCSRHTCCGHQIEKGSVVKFIHERMAWRDQGRAEDVLAVYAVKGDGTTTCKVVFLPLHLAVCPGAYDGVYARVVPVYCDRSDNGIKRQKFWCNKGCCVARVVGDTIANGGGLVLILAGSLFYGTVSFKKKLLSIFLYLLSTTYLSYLSSVH